MNPQELVGKTIKAIRAIKSDKTEPSYILFTDGETIMEFEEQDGYDYHDCDSHARTIKISKDKVRWDRMFNDIKYYVDCKNTDAWSSF